MVNEKKKMDCYDKILEWLDQQKSEFPEDNMEPSEVIAYAVIEMVKRQIELFKNEEKI